MKNLTFHRLKEKKQGQMTGLSLLIYSFQSTHKILFPTVLHFSTSGLDDRHPQLSFMV